MMSVRLLLALCACLLLIAVEQTWASQLTRRTPREDATLPRPTILYSTIGTHVILTCHVEGINAYIPLWYIFFRSGQRIAEPSNDDSYELSMTSVFNDGMYRCLTGAEGLTTSPLSNAFRLHMSIFARQLGPVAILPNRNGTHGLLTCYDQINDPIIRPTIRHWTYWYKNERLKAILSPRVNQTYVLSMTSHDEGNYSCETRGLGRRQAPIRSDTFEFVVSEFEVTPPTPTILHKRTEPLYIMLTCHVENHQEFSQPWSYLWWKNGEHIASFFNHDSYVVSWSSQYEGNYSCEMDAGGARSPRSNTFVFDTSEPARPTILYSRNGTHVILTCRVEERSTYSRYRHYNYVFMKNGQRIARLDNEDSYELSITSPSNDGMYRCSVSAYGLIPSPLSNPFQVVMSSSGPVTISYSTNGTHLLLTCHDEDITRYNRPMTVWYKNRRFLVMLSHDYDHSYALSMTSHNDGKYTCEIIEEESWRTISHFWYLLPRSATFEFVMSEFEATPPRPTLWQLIKGSERSLNCRVRNPQRFSQPWSYLFWKNDELIALLFNVDEYTSPAFSITSQDEGNYSCVMDAGGARSPRSNTFVLDMSAPQPFIPPRPSLLNRTNETHVILTCHVENRSASSQSLNYVWWLYDRLIISALRHLESDELDITSGELREEGNYSCETMTPEVDIYSFRSNTFVFASAPATPPWPRILPSTNDTHVILTCHVEYRTAYNRRWLYKWWKNDESIEGLFNNDSYALSMTSLDNGNYACEIDAEGVLSPRSNPFELVMTAPVPAIPPKPSLLNSTDGTLVILTCHVEDRSAYNRPWGYLWWKNDQRITRIFTEYFYAFSKTSQNEGNYSCVMSAGGIRSPRSDSFEFVIPASDIGNG